MKKVMLLICLILFINTKSYAVYFADLDRYEYAYNPIYKLAEEGVLVGTSDGMYKPEEKITKPYFLKVMAKLVGYKEPIVSVSTEEDIQKLGGLYTKYYEMISRYRESYKIWDKTLEKTILFLMDQNLIEESYLKNMIEKQGNLEVESVLTKEELGLCLIRMMDFLGNEIPDVETLYQYSILRREDEGMVCKAILALNLYRMQNHLEETTAEEIELRGVINDCDPDRIQIMDDEKRVSVYVPDELVKEKLTHFVKGTKVKMRLKNLVLKDLVRDE